MGDRQLGQTVDARMALVRAVEPLLDQMAEEATQAIWRDVSVYRDNPDANLRLQVVVHCRAVFETFLTILREDRLPTRQEFPTTLSQALFRVGQGVSLADFLRAFRVGQLAYPECPQEVGQRHPLTDPEQRLAPSGRELLAGGQAVFPQDCQEGLEDGATVDDDL